MAVNFVCALSIYDGNTDISTIRYNVLNLPDTIQFVAGHQNYYTYDASGKKLEVQNITSRNILNLPQDTITRLTSSTTLTTDYCGDAIYQDSSLKEILTPEGYWQNGVYYYYLKDHQGNNTEVLNQSKTVMEYSDYYPDGMRFEESTSNSTALPYRYNGKELESMNGLNQYDYGARRRETGIPVWTTVDPLCEKYYSVSPYAYVEDDPINKIDPDGKEDILVKQNKDDRLTNAESLWLIYPTGTFNNVSMETLRNMTANALEQKYGKPEFARQGSSLPDNPTKSDNDKSGNATVVEGRFKYEKSFINAKDENGNAYKIPALLLDQGKGAGRVSTIYKNYRHSGEREATGVALHAGRVSWQVQIMSGKNGTLTKGSEGCVVAPIFGPIYNKVDNKGNVIIVRNQEEYENGN
ncbi:RHS repeat domain-containing protein [Microbacter margulisiae]|uniref:RHS repeat-associated protein n=1 Tax=Microbacter margulisiae TaxID=1350067 RepID=A0A7W5H2S4_9PORP|nr:RHS repeat-associated core domain-containing protein [Microbacter margulisiae]MBB3187864.1 RHS repeat-associated protein [Microbacter margulisiae]